MGKTLFNLIRYIKNGILDNIFEGPPTCIVCNLNEEVGLCKSCKNTITLCKEESSYGYYKGALKELIFLFKFRKDFFAGEILVSMLKEKIKDIPKDYIITYIPISKRSLKERGFNQCEYLGKNLGKELGLKCLETLVKVKETKRQKELSKSERFKNIKDSFGVINKEKINGKRFILIDDVLTTGATLLEGEKILKENGALEIKLLTIGKSRI